MNFLSGTTSNVHNRDLTQSLLTESDEALQSPHSPRSTAFVVKVPRGARGGRVVKIELPGGFVQRIVVPPGLVGGDRFQVHVDTTQLQDSRREARNGHNNVSRGRDEVSSIGIDQDGGQSRSLESLDPERAAFIAALPEDMQRELLEQEGAQFAMLDSLHGSAAGEARELGGPQKATFDAGSVVNGKPTMLRVTVPESKGEFQVELPDGSVKMMTVPEGINPGEVIGIPVETTTSGASEEELDTNKEVSRTMDLLQ